MERICLGKKGKFLTLEVPGLAERRPSLVNGDSIFVKLATEDANYATRTYQVRFHTCAGLRPCHLGFANFCCHFV